MKHDLEFQKPPPKTEALARELAAAYAMTFLGSEHGKKVLADLRAKFGLHRLVFTSDASGYDTIKAALTEGERRVMSEIEGALDLHGPVKPISEPKKETAETK